MEQQITIGKRIAMLRKNHGWTQEQLGEKVGVSAQAVSKWENDQACPDITIIPLLSNLFGVTTDELLGVKPVDPHVVIIDKDKEKRDDDIEKGGFEFRYVDQWAGIITCITAILVCVMLIIRSTTPLFNNPEYTTWSYIWPILVFGLGLISLRKNIVFGIAAMIIGIYEFIWFGWGVPFEVKWYVILLILAIAYLLHLLLRKMGIIKKHFFPIVKINGNKPEVSEYTVEDYNLIADLSFGSNHIVYEYDTLKGMKIDTTFGEHQIDLRNVKYFLNNPILDVDVNFGNVVILLPHNVKIYKNSDTAFAAMKINGEPSPDADQVAYLKGDVNFGNLEIRYSAL